MTLPTPSGLFHRRRKGAKNPRAMELTECSCGQVDWRESVSVATEINGLVIQTTGTPSRLHPLTMVNKPQAEVWDFKIWCKKLVSSVNKCALCQKIAKIITLLIICLRIFY